MSVREHQYPSKSDKIAIIGAGISGIRAGCMLRDYGFNNVTLFEKNIELGGKIKSVSYDNASFELGAYVYPAWSKTLYDQIAMFDIVTLNGPVTSSYFDESIGLIPRGQYTSKLKHLLEFFSLRKFIKMSDMLYQKNYNELPYDSQLAVSIEQFAKSCGISEFSKALQPFFTGMGWGHYDTSCAIYYLKTLNKHLIAEMKQRAIAPDKAFGIRLIECGAQKMLEKFSHDLDIQFNKNIIKIQRDDPKIPIKLYTDDEVYHADWIIVTETGPFLTDIMDCDEIEKTLFSAISYYPYATSLFRASDMPSNSGFLYFIDSTQHYQAYSPLLFSQPYVDKEIYLSYCYTDVASDNTVALVEQGLKAGIKRLKGQLQTILDTQLWPNYFPHFSIQHIQENYYHKFEDLQGKKNTFYCGSLLAFELTYMNFEYVTDLINKFFCPPQHS